MNRNTRRTRRPRWVSWILCTGMMVSGLLLQGCTQQLTQLLGGLTKNLGGLTSAGAKKTPSSGVRRTPTRTGSSVKTGSSVSANPNTIGKAGNPEQGIQKADGSGSGNQPGTMVDEFGNTVRVNANGTTEIVATDQAGNIGPDENATPAQSTESGAPDDWPGPDNLGTNTDGSVIGSAPDDPGLYG